MDRPLRDVAIGIFGAGHLARALASRLLRAGVAEGDLSLCHRGAAATRRALEDAGLSHLVRRPADVLNRSDMLLYTVRPQDYTAIAEHSTPDGLLFVSFLAGVPLARIPVRVPQSRRVRVMPSTPDTFTHGDAIAAVYPAGNATVHALLDCIGVRSHPLCRESDMHAFTVLGPCLPAVLAFWESLGRTVDEREILDVAARSELPDPDAILRWARAVQPRGLTDQELSRHLDQAATQGGVTEAVLLAIRDGKSLPDSLCCGIHHSRRLGQTEAGTAERTRQPHGAARRRPAGG